MPPPMLETHFMVADRLLAPADLHAALGRLAAAGWRAALLAARQAVLESARISQPFAAAATLLPSAAAAALPTASGDLLFQGDDLFYIITKPQGRARWQRPAPLPRPPAADAPELEVGLISPARASAAGRLGDFASRLAAALRLSGAAGDWTWRQPPAADRLAALRQGGEWQPPRASLRDYERAQAAADPLARQLLERLARDGFARESELLEGPDPAARRAALAALAAANLIRRDLLISCHLSRRPLLVLAEPAQKDSPAVAARQCPDCGLGLGDEPLEIVLQPIAPSPGRDAPPWELLWITERLHRLGAADLLWYRDLPEWSPLRAIAAAFAGQAWAWAVAPRALTETHVRGLDSLRRRFALDRLALIALAGVAPAARASLRDASLAPPLAEGFAAAEAQLVAALSEAALQYAAARLQPLEDSAGFPLLATLRALYGRAPR